MATDPSRAELLSEPGLRPAGASAALVAALLLAAAVRLGPSSTELLVATVVAAGSVALTAPFSLGVGALGWALYTGFVEHRYGELTFTAADLLRLAVLLTLAVTVAWGTRPTITGFPGESPADVLGLTVPRAAEALRSGPGREAGR
jgi:hypothetical protein